MVCRVEKVVTSRSAGPGEVAVTTNVWLVGDDDEVVVIDAAHDAEAILAAVGDRKVRLVLCTHGHRNHVDAALEVAAAADAEIALHPHDDALWEQEYGDVMPDLDLVDGWSVDVADVVLAVLHTPGHTPGSVSVYADELGVLFTGDCPTRTPRLRLLPSATTVHPGHGADTTLGAVPADG